MLMEAIARRRRVARFSLPPLFAAGEQGILNDLSDLSTLFTDVAGTTPVTAPGQTVARVNDKLGRGNHLTQSVAAARPIYGRHPAGGIRNRLAATELFSDAYWTKSNTNVTPNTTIAPDGTLTADTITGVTAGTANSVFVDTTSVNSVYTLSFSVRAGTANTCAALLRNNTGGANINATAVILSGPGSVSGTTTQTVIGLSATEWTRVAVTTDAAVPAGIALRAFLFPETGISANVTSKSNIFWGLQLEPGSTATPYQRVGAPSGLAFPQPQSYDITEAGVPSLHYLFCDGLARWMVSPTITPGTDKAQVFVGVRKLSDAAIGVVVETSATAVSNNGVILLRAPRAANPSYGFGSKGTAFAEGQVNAGFAAPISNVLTGIGDISGDIARLRINGAQVAQDTADQGTGNYGNYQLYIGSRGGTSLFFNGLIYSIIVRFGPNLPLSTIQQVERWTAQRTGVTLP